MKAYLQFSLKFWVYHPKIVEKYITRGLCYVFLLLLLLILLLLLVLLSLLYIDVETQEGAIM